MLTLTHPADPEINRAEAIAAALLAEFPADEAMIIGISVIALLVKRTKGDPAFVELVRKMIFDA
jgi:hypothetical protein